MGIYPVLRLRLIQATLSVTAPYFLATKVEAFKSRGNNDFLGSHDFEDIITVIAGCVDIDSQVHVSSDDLKSHLKLIFNEFLKNDQFTQSLPGHVSDGQRQCNAFKPSWKE